MDSPKSVDSTAGSPQKKTKNREITAVIPIRGGSTRCEHKSIRSFGDTTLLELRVNTLKKVEGIDRIQVNSDCDFILEKAKELGVETFKRDPKYGTSTADGAMVYECLSEACPTDTMLIAFTPTPFITAYDYQYCIEKYLEGVEEQTCDSVITVKKVDSYMFHEKTPFNFNPLKTCKSQDLPNYYKMTFGVTIVDTKFVRKHHSIWTENPFFYQVDQMKAMDIDTNLDFFLCEQLYKENLPSVESVDKFMKEQLYVPPNKNDNIDVPSDVYLGAVYDALNIIHENAKDCVLDIKPAAGYKKIIHGPALTLTGRKIRKDEDYSEMDNYRFNFYDPKYYVDNPIIILESNDSIISHTGDITSTIFKKLGARGYITNGIARDVELISEVGLPVFTRGVNPIDAISNEWAYTDINVPIQIDNLLIYPEDYIFASRDGVIVIPKEKKNAFFIELNKILEKERNIRKFVRNTSKGQLQTHITEFIRKHGRF